jgi:predicted neuraminidase
MTPAGVIAACVLIVVGEGDAFPRDILAAPDSGGAVLVREFIADSMPTAQCHASTIAESHGRLVAAWFGGEYERHPDVGIWLSRRDSGGWTKPVMVADGRAGDTLRYPCWNPVLFQPSRGPLMLFYKVGPSPSSWWGMLMTSSDGGVTWGEPVRLPDGIVGPVKNKPVECPDGVIVCPSSTEGHNWRVRSETTADGGVTWKVSNFFNDTAEVQAIQPSFVRSGASGILAFGRTKQQRMFFAHSFDCGGRWSDLVLTNLPNPNSGVDAAGLPDGRIIVLYNDGRGDADHWEAGRDVLAVALSDDGRLWKRVLVLENERGGEFSYPALILGADGLLHATYTWKRRKIAHLVLDPAQLEAPGVRNRR